MNWPEMLSNMAISTEKPIDPSLIYLAMLIDLYKSSKNEELKLELENGFIKILRTQV